jgi:hypothetical protein
VSADEWAALGQVGSFVVAIGALIFAIVSRKDSKEALDGAARSATAAEVSAQAAKDAVREAARANELTESDQRERASTQAAREQHEAELVSGSIVIEDGGLIDSERIEVYKLRVTVENHSSQPVHNVTFRHTQHYPSFQLLDRVIAPGGQQWSTYPVELFETLRDGTELIRGTEIKYKLRGVEWIRRGDAPPVKEQPGSG